MRPAVCVAWAVWTAVAGAQEFRASPLGRGERADVGRLLERVTAGRRAADPNLSWAAHFMKGPDRRVYVPFTLTLRNTSAFELAAIGIRVAERGPVSARFGQYNYRTTFEETYAVETRRAPDAGRFFRSALVLRPGRYDVFIAVQDRAVAEGPPPSMVLMQTLDVPDLHRKGLLLSSIMLVDRVEPFADGEPRAPTPERPYALGTAEIVPADDAEFGPEETLTVAFLVYNPATFVDGKPDVQVDYRVVRADSGRTIGSTEPQLFDVDTLPEEFSANEGHQLTPVQSLPLAQFEAGKYRLEIEVQDHLGRARTRAQVPFTIVR